MRSQDVIASISPELAKHLSQGSFKTVEQVAQFSPEGHVNRPIFSTGSLQFGMYCLELGQVDALHKHPQSDEICYFVQGIGEVVIGDDVAAVQPGVCILYA